jgi:hypothetical protein
MPTLEWVLAISRNCTTRTVPNPGHTEYLDKFETVRYMKRGNDSACVHTHTTSDSSTVCHPVY